MTQYSKTEIFWESIFLGPYVLYECFIENTTPQAEL